MALTNCIYGLLCAQRGLKSKSSWNKAEILAAVVEPELLLYSSDVADVVVSKLLTSHKATTIRTLTRRAQLVCDSPDSLTDEIKYLLDNVFNKNNYDRDWKAGLLT